MVITGEYVVKGLFHHCVVKGGLFHPVNHFFFFLHNPPSLFRADVSERRYSMIIQMHRCTYIRGPSK